MMEHPHAPPPEVELPKDACPNGCRGYTQHPLVWLDGQEHHEDTRCLRCGQLWKQGESPNKR